MDSQFIQKVTLQESPIKVSDLRSRRPNYGSYGGYASFEGIVRDTNDGKRVKSLYYECYETMARKELIRIVDLVGVQYGVGYAEVVHRTGALAVGELAVFIQVLSVHRREAFQACMSIIDNLKETVPIWKKEYYLDGSEAWPRCEGCRQGAHSADYHQKRYLKPDAKTKSEGFIDHDVKLPAADKIYS